MALLRGIVMIGVFFRAHLDSLLVVKSLSLFAALAHPEKEKHARSEYRGRTVLDHRERCRRHYRNNRESQLAKDYEYQSANPQKVAANRALNNAIRRGEIKRQSCSKCGSTFRVHGHHRDYTKPLDVVWLCPRCHRQEHLNAAA